MTTDHIRQLLENAIKLLAAHKRTNDETLLAMVDSLLGLAREDLAEMGATPRAFMNDELLDRLQQIQPTPYPGIPEGTYAYMAPNVGWDPPSGVPQKYGTTTTSDTITVPPKEKQ